MTDDTSTRAVASSSTVALEGVVVNGHVVPARNVLLEGVSF
jgi:hypothetical protein